MMPIGLALAWQDEAGRGDVAGGGCTASHAWPQSLISRGVGVGCGAERNRDFDVSTTRVDASATVGTISAQGFVLARPDRRCQVRHGDTGDKGAPQPDECSSIVSGMGAFLLATVVEPMSRNKSVSVTTSRSGPKPSCAQAYCFAVAKPVSTSSSPLRLRFDRLMRLLGLAEADDVWPLVVLDSVSMRDPATVCAVASSSLCSALSWRGLRPVCEEVSEREASVDAVEDESPSLFPHASAPSF